MEEKICQSCGMNMNAAQNYGSNADETPNQEYCSYCYQNGTFILNITMEEMLDKNLKFLNHWNEETGNNYTADEARPIFSELLLSLKRWAKNGL